MTGRAAVVRRRLAYGGSPSQFVEVWEPAVVPLVGTAVLLHGGYWRDRWDLHLMDALAADLAGRRWLVANVEYRRVGGDGGGWPTTFDDVLEALGRCAALIDGLAEEAAGEQDRGRRAVVVIGHSAGGHLGLWATARRPELVDAVVALAPVSDLFEASRRGLSDHAVHGLLGGDPVRHPDRYWDADPVSHLPLRRRTLVVHGTADRAVPLALSDAYVDEARAAGDDVTYHRPEGVDHFAVIDPRSAAWQGVASWLSTVTKP